MTHPIAPRPDYSDHATMPTVCIGQPRSIAIKVHGMPGPQGGWVVYSLATESDGVRYIGVTKQSIRKRMSAHLYRARSSDTHKDRWIRSLLARGDVPFCTIVEVGSVGDDWRLAERTWIAKLTLQGVDLVNTTSGGDGCEGYRHSAETRKAASERMRGKTLSEGHKAAISASLVGRKKPEQTKINMSGHVISQETRAKISKALVGKKATAETLRRMSEARKGKQISDQARASRPKKLSESHRLAISEGLKNSERRRS